MPVKSENSINSILGGKGLPHWNYFVSIEGVVCRVCLPLRRLSPLPQEGVASLLDRVLHNNITWLMISDGVPATNSQTYYYSIFPPFSSSVNSCCCSFVCSSVSAQLVTCLQQRQWSFSYQQQILPLNSNYDVNGAPPLTATTTTTSICRLPE